MSTGPTPTPTPAPVKHPVLRNIGQLLLKYGPVLLQWLLQSGILKLPPGVTLPPLPTLPTAAAKLDPSHPVFAQVGGVNCEVDEAALKAHIGDLIDLL